MHRDLQFDSISSEKVENFLKQYDDVVPARLQDLQNFRLERVPTLLKERKADGNAFLEKQDVTGLVEWKLKYGTYRPSLAKLVASNTPESISTISSEAFKLYEENKLDVGAALKVLTRLRGIGPATASLLLASYDPCLIPFFSDELFRYLQWEEGKLQGWDRKIKYTLKEYMALYDKVLELRTRLESEAKVKLSVQDLEKVAYVIYVQDHTSSDTAQSDTEVDTAPPPSKRRKK